MRAGWVLFKAQTRAANRRRLLGWLWLFLPTVVISVLALSMRRAGIIDVKVPAANYPAFVLTGLIAWYIFTDALMAPLNALRRHQGLISRNPLPHEAIMVAALLNLMFDALARTVVLLSALWLLTDVAAPVGIAAIPGLLVPLAIGFAFGIWIAPLCLVHDDLADMLPFGLMLLLFLSPVFYPLGQLFFAQISPVGPAIEAYRSLALGLPLQSGAVAWFLGSFVIGSLGWLSYRRGKADMIARLG